MQVERISGIGDIDPDAWNALIPDNDPFLSHAFLLALEKSGSVSKTTGWTPQHILLRDAKHTVVAAMPLYYKTHSYGEFVFDWAWADAYERTGLRYYPKLLCAVPFSPIRGARLLGGQPDALINSALSLADDTDCSSLHVLFPTSQQSSLQENETPLLRMDCQFHWENEDYGDFEEFLSSMRSERRRKIRRERAKIKESGFCFNWISGRDLNQKMIIAIYELLAMTYRVRGRSPYLQPIFFELIADLMPDAIRVLLVTKKTKLVACAFFLQSEQQLFGRYWGSDEHYPLLHFEACYYQGIEYCLANKLRYFDPGTQGEHKLLRGFRPQEVYSWHWIRHTEMSAAIADYLQRERTMVTNYIERCRQCLPFKETEDDLEL